MTSTPTLTAGASPAGPDGTHGRDFARATTLTSRRDGSYAAHLDGAWSIAGALNGGYLLALLARAAVTEVSAGRPAGSAPLHPVAATSTFLSAPSPGPAVAAVELLRSGRRTVQARARLLQGGEPRVEVHLVLGKLGDDAATWDGVAPVVLPPVDECYRLPVHPPGAPFTVDLMGVVDERLDPDCLGFVSGRPTGRGELRGWLALGDPGDSDVLRLLLAVDALPPATFDLGIIGHAPTLSLSAHVRALPAPGPLAVRQQARLLDSGLVDEVCDVWDSTGRLVAHATQLAMVRSQSGGPSRG